MSNRVVYGALPGGGFGLRVSRPGHDVTNTGLTGKQLSFDSRWPSSARIHQVATIVVPTGAHPTYSAYGFGTTFPDIPPVFAFVVTAADTLRPIAFAADGSIQNWENYAPLTFTEMGVYTDRVEFLRHPSATKTIRYFVLRPI